MAITVFKKLFLFGLIWFLLHSEFIIADGLTQDHQHADCALVLGNTVNPDGSLSPRLEKRLERSFDLYSNHQVGKIMVSGGLGKEGFYEGSKMRAYLKERGIPDSCILVDNSGNNTEASVINFLALKSRYQLQSVIVVSQYFHISRIKMLFRKHRMKKVLSASPYYFEWRDFYAIFREFFAYYLYQIYINN
ncbi:MAG: YdcF family protein [Bacteroidetes bacterium]|nr:YdcF family protein [Bacteroidota bacterium]